MKTVYKNGRYSGQCLTVNHLIRRLEIKYISVKIVRPLDGENARIKADDDIFSIVD